MRARHVVLLQWQQFIAHDAACDIAEFLDIRWKAVTGRIGMNGVHGGDCVEDLRIGSYRRARRQFRSIRSTMKRSL